VAKKRIDDAWRARKVWVEVREGERGKLVENVFPAFSVRIILVKCWQKVGIGACGICLCLC
jgi:hypothetical protein